MLLIWTVQLVLLCFEKYLEKASQREGATFLRNRERPYKEEGRMVSRRDTGWKSTRWGTEEKKKRKKITER